ncbi:MAG: signal peptide peptidase SppA [Candidatus Zixiibacteriota bacterium]
MKKRTVVILVVIASCIVFFGFAALMLIVGLAGEFDTEFTGFGDKIAIVEIYGEISDSRDVIRQLKHWTEDGSVKAILIDIDSPGGAVAPSQEIYEQILKTREEGKTVVSSMRNVAASGGYYIASATEKIVANPGTLTGSIGVILSFPTAKKLMEKIGLQMETIKSGELKDVGAMSRPMTPQEERMLQAVIDDSYEQFVEAVANGRKKSKEEIYPFADGSIFTGRQAYNIGLVDTLGSFETAVSITGEMVNLGPDPDLVIERKRQPGFFEILSQSLTTINGILNTESRQPGLQYKY